ncbi:hypothetical protein BJY00DRAFT_319593 [Aspergillus carlsbadensis]|nr:hypothetical protein BJY00DRAFT_319593 [Aspergillus carlsbadensis]
MSKMIAFSWWSSFELTASYPTQSGARVTPSVLLREMGITLIYSARSRRAGTLTKDSDSVACLKSRISECRKVDVQKEEAGNLLGSVGGGIENE